MSEAALELAGVTRDFDQGGRVLHVLRGASLGLDAGEVVALVGPSGFSTRRCRRISLFLLSLRSSSSGVIAPPFSASCCA